VIRENAFRADYDVLAARKQQQQQQHTNKSEISRFKAGTH